MHIDIITLFPKMFLGPFSQSLIARAQKKGLLSIKIHNLRKWAKDKHKTVDDTPYGGGEGMVLKVDVIERAISDIVQTSHEVISEENQGPMNLQNHSTPSKNKPYIILLSPQGKQFKQSKAKYLSKKKHLILIAGHYEGFDERIRKHLIDEEISIGDYVLTGGEIPAMVITDAIVRLIPGVVGKKESIKRESFAKIQSSSSRSRNNENCQLSYLPKAISKNKKVRLLDYPVYTKPQTYRGWKVPKVLLSGDHKKIEEWREKQALKNTRRKRPDLLNHIRKEFNKK